MPAIAEDTSGVKNEPVAARTRRHDTEPIASRTRSQPDLTEMASIAHVKIGSNLNEWLN